MARPDEQQSASTGRFLGQWNLLRSEGQDDQDETSLEFRPGGELTYTIRLPDRVQIIQLSYEVVGDELVTDQPSQPRLERSRYYFEDHNTLVIEFGGLRTWFSRASGAGAV